MADTTTATSWPALRVLTIRLATRLMPSASATEDPPYFCTTRATWPNCSRSAGGALLSNVKAGVCYRRGQCPQRRSAVGAPVVHVRVLPPPQRLQRPPRLVVLEPMDQVGGHGGDVVGDAEWQAGRVLVRVEYLGVLVARAEQLGQPGTQLVQV